MANQFFIWKDQNCNGVNPEWLEITGDEFYKLTNNKNNENRYFVRDYFNLDKIELGHFTFEVTKEDFKKWDAARKRKERSSDVLDANSKKAKLSLRDDIDELQYSNIPSVVSFETPISEEEDLTFHDVVADENNDFDELAKKLFLEEIYKISRQFPAMERELVDWLYFNNSDEKTESEFGRKYNLTHQAVNYQKKKIIEKLKKFLQVAKKMSQ